MIGSTDSAARITTMSTFPHLVKEKEQPWKAFLPVEEASSLAGALYDGVSSPCAVEGAWIRGDDFLANVIAMSGIDPASRGGSPG